MLRKKNRNPLTDEEKFQQALLQEKELVNLHRKYVIFERDQRIREEFIGGASQNRDNKIRLIFEDELRNIRTDLSIATTKEKKVEDAKVMQRISILVDEYTDATENVNRHKLEIKEIEGQIKMVKKNVIRLASLQITDVEHQRRIYEGMVILEKVENKLEVQTKKFCTVCTKNRRLREEIEHLCKVRAIFMKTWNDLIKKLAFGKQIIIDLIEQATIAFDQREEWCMKLRAVKAKAALDFNRSKQELNWMNRKDHHNQQLIEFISTKSQKRVMSMLIQKERFKRVKRQERLREKLVDLETMMEEIRLFLNEDNARVIGKKFDLDEERNFSNFSYVIDLIKETEDSSVNLGILRLEIDDRKLLQEERLQQQANRLETIRIELGDKTQIANQAEKELQNLDSSLQNMMSGINRLFKMCKCYNDPLIRLLGKNQSVETYNVLLYLQILEEKIALMLLKANLHDRYLKEKKKISSDQALISTQRPSKIYTIEDIVLNDPCPLCVERDVVFDVIDKKQCVYSREKAIKEVNKRMLLPEGPNSLHRVSKCMLPKCREIIQKRLVN